MLHTVVGSCCPHLHRRLSLSLPTTTNSLLLEKILCTFLRDGPALPHDAVVSKTTPRSRHVRNYVWMYSNNNMKER
jgi:hypothetical protein